MEHSMRSELLAVRTKLTVHKDVTLRILAPSEGHLLYAVVDANREHLRQWLPWVAETTQVAVSRRFLEQLFAAYEQRKSIHYGIFLNGELVGMVGFHAFDWRNRLTSLGYWLAAGACGRGIMRKCVAVCIDEAFRLGMNRISIRCAVGNERSRRIPVALGFKSEGIQRQAEWLNGRFVDLEVFSLLASERDSYFAAT
jgi:ribosomal-protein-serine acetyltransferase